MKPFGLLLACVIPVLGLLLCLGGIYSEKTWHDSMTCENQQGNEHCSEYTREGRVVQVETQSTGIINHVDKSNASRNNNGRKQNGRNPDDCSLILADSSIVDGGWGLFTLKSRRKGEKFPSSDLVIQIPDPNPRNAHGMRRIVWDYLWDGQETSGPYEGQRVMSMIPGIGMLANGEFNLHNVLPYKIDIDDADLKRHQSPGAGAFTHYHNFTWYANREIEAGGEVFVNYGETGR
jgi:hypothetical protein